MIFSLAEGMGFLPFDIRYGIKMSFDTSPLFTLGNTYNTHLRSINTNTISPFGEPSHGFFF